MAALGGHVIVHLSPDDALSAVVATELPVLTPNFVFPELAELSHPSARWVEAALRFETLHPQIRFVSKVHFRTNFV